MYLMFGIKNNTQGPNLYHMKVTVRNITDTHKHDVPASFYPSTYGRISCLIMNLEHPASVLADRWSISVWEKVSGQFWGSRGQ